MPLDLIYSNEFGSAHYDRGQKLVRTQYVGIVKVEAIIDLLTKVMEYAGKHEIKFMLANLTGMQGTFTGALEFFEKQFYPTMIRHGLISYASALPKDVFTKFSAAQLQKKVEGKLDWQAFSDLNDAEKWTTSHIENLKNPPGYRNVS